MGRSRPLFSTDGKNTKLGRIIFIKETKARTGSFPKPLHRDVHLLSFWIAGYRTQGKSLHGAAQSSVLILLIKYLVRSGLSLILLNTSTACINQKEISLSHCNNKLFVQVLYAELSERFTSISYDSSEQICSSPSIEDETKLHHWICEMLQSGELLKEGTATFH